MKEKSNKKELIGVIEIEIELIFYLMMNIKYEIYQK